MHKVSIVAMTIFLAEALIAKYDWNELDISNPEEVQQQCDKLLETQAEEFWLCDWTVKISDATAVRDKIVESLTKISRNIRGGKTWHDEIDLVTL